MREKSTSELTGQLKLVGCSLGNCVHVAGVANFLRLAESNGFTTILLGAAVPPQILTERLAEIQPAAACVSYRLTPENCRQVLNKLKEALATINFHGKLLFGGTAATVAVAEELGMFDYCFIGGENMDRITAVFEWLRGKPLLVEGDLVAQERPPIQEAIDNLPIINRQGLRMPLLRHHFGLPSMEETVEGVRQISEARVLDVISIGSDQNAQEYFFRPEELDSELDGAGGAPIRSEKDLLDLHHSRQYGNRPYLRIYSGTQDLKKWAELSVRTIDNAWGTIPLSWYSELDGRSKRPLAEAIRENMSAIRWYAQIGKPVEINEPHQWSLRDAPDTVAVAMAYISAYAAKKLGVKQYFAQYMFNNPSFTSSLHDLAKIAAKSVLVESLEDEEFRTYRQVRAGLAHFAVDIDVAKGQLGMATSVMMNFNPHILHVVSFTEADHAARADEVIESAKIAGGVIRNISAGVPNPFADPRIKEDAERLFAETQVLLGAVKLLGESIDSSDPLADPGVLARAISGGIFDAPHLRGQPCVPGTVRTLPVNGGCVAVDENGEELNEWQRLREPAERLKLDYSRILRLEPEIEMPDL